MSPTLRDLRARKSGQSGVSALVDACERGDLEALRGLLAKDAPIDVARDDGVTAAGAAAEGGHLAVLELLAGAGADLDRPSGFYGRTPLGAAAEWGHSDVVLYLLARGVHADVPSAREDRTPLQAWCETALGGTGPEVVERLVTAGADVNRRGRFGRTALHGAARWGRAEIVGALLACGADPNAPDGEGRTPLHHACESSNGSQTVEVLIAAGADVEAADGKGSRPLHCACARFDAPAETVRALLGAGASAHARNGSGEEPIASVFFLITGDEVQREKVRLLLDAGAEVGAHLESAVRLGDAGIVEAFLARGADPRAVFRWGWGPLHVAAQGGHAGVIEVLAAGGADVGGADERGDTPLHVACRVQAAEAALELLRAGAALTRNAAGHEPLFYADADTRARLFGAFPGLAATEGALEEETRDGLRCRDRSGPAESCAVCGWRAPEGRRLRCPWCGRRAVDITDHEVLHGNPYTPAADTEVRFTYTCGHCGLEFQNGWNALNTSRPAFSEVRTGASWQSEDGGSTWRRVWGVGE